MTLAPIILALTFIGGVRGGPSAAGLPPPAAKPAPAAVSSTQAATAGVAGGLSASFPPRRPVIGPNGSERQLRRLLDAIRRVESADDDRAVGDGGRSVGPYQCGLAAFLEGGGRREDYPRLAYDRRATERVMLRYWQRYGATTDEDRARLWNVGPAWRTRARAAGERYWQRVKAVMKGADNGH